MHSTLIELYRITKKENKTLENKEIIKKILITYNNSIHIPTKYTPYELIFGKPYNVKIPYDSEHTYLQDLEKARKKVYKHVVTLEINKKTNRINKLNSNRQDLELPSEGQEIFIKNNRRNKIDDRFKVHQVDEITPNDEIYIRYRNNQKAKVHPNKIMKRRMFQNLGVRGHRNRSKARNTRSQ